MLEQQGMLGHDEVGNVVIHYLSRENGSLKGTCQHLMWCVKPMQLFLFYVGGPIMHGIFRYDSWRDIEYGHDLMQIQR